MDAPRTVPAVSASQAEEFFTSGTQAYPAEPSKTCSCGGVDTPGCGRLHTAECAFRQTPPSQRRLLNNEPPALLVPQECENADDVELLAGIERNMKVLNDRRARREDLLSSLIFAARNLAERNLLPSLGAQCAECGMLRRLGRHAHTDTCKTGRVLGIIAELVATANFNHKEKENASVEETSPQRLRPVAEDPEEHRVDDGIRPRGLAERVCLKCGARGGFWDAQQRPEEEVQLSSLGMNQCVGAGIEGRGHTLYTHLCESRARAVASKAVDEMAEGGAR